MQIITQKHILKSKNVDTISVIIFVKIKNIINIKKSTETIIPKFYVYPIKNNLRPVPCAQCSHDPYGAHPGKDATLGRIQHSWYNYQNV